MSDVPAVPDPPPGALEATGDVDGWTLPLAPGTHAGAARVAMLGAGLAVFGALVMVSISLASAVSAGVLIGIGVLGVLLFAGLMVLVNRQPRQDTLQIGATHLVLDRGGRRQRIPWSQVAPPRRLRDHRDDWTQAFHASLQTQEFDAPIRADAPPGAVVVRWTTDGQPAAFAHEGTAWEHVVLAKGLPSAALAWLVRTLDAAREADAEARRQSTFDEAVSGGEGARAQAALRELVDKRER